MQIIVVLTVFMLAYVYAMPYEILESNTGEQFYLLPLQRGKRDTTWDVAKSLEGTRVTIGQEGNIYDKGGHKITGGGFISKSVDPSGPETYGGKVQYHNNPTNITATIAKTPRWGTDLELQASRVLLGDKDTKLEAYADARQHFGGLPGDSKPEPNFGLQFIHNTNLFGG